MIVLSESPIQIPELGPQNVPCQHHMHRMPRGRKAAVQSQVEAPARAAYNPFLQLAVRRLKSHAQGARCYKTTQRLITGAVVH